MKNFKFQKKAQVRGEEELRETVHLVDSGLWGGLVAVALTVLLAISLAFFVKIPENLTVQGILLDPAGVVGHPILVEVPKSQSNVRILKFHVNSGDEVRPGQVIAEYTFRDHQDQSASVDYKLRNLRDKRLKVEEVQKIEASVEEESLLQNQKFAREKIMKQKATIKILADMHDRQSQLFESGSGSLFDRHDAQMALSKAKSVLIDEERKLAVMEPENKSKKIARTKALNEIDFQIANLQSELDQLGSIHDKYRFARSPWSGKVVETLLHPGDPVSSGQTLANLIPSGRKEKLNQDHTLLAHLFVPVADGKRLRAGMSVKVDPSTIEAQEYGKIVGKILSITENPASEEGLQRMIGNESLVEKFSEDGSPMLATVELIRNPEEAEKYSWAYSWTTSDGPEESIKSGTHCTGDITLRRQRLITLLIPALEPYMTVDDDS